MTTSLKYVMMNGEVEKKGRGKMNKADKIREEYKNTYVNWNGAYIICICTGCQEFWTDPEGRTATAKIVKECKQCFTPSPSFFQKIKKLFT